MQDECLCVDSKSTPFCKILLLNRIFNLTLRPITILNANLKCSHLKSSYFGSYCYRKSLLVCAESSCLLI